MGASTSIIYAIHLLLKRHTHYCKALLTAVTTSKHILRTFLFHYSAHSQALIKIAVN